MLACVIDLQHRSQHVKHSRLKRRAPAKVLGHGCSQPVLKAAQLPLEHAQAIAPRGEGRERLAAKSPALRRELLLQQRFGGRMRIGGVHTSVLRRRSPRLRPCYGMKIVAGCSSRSLSAWIIAAASKPSTNR